MTVVSDTTPLNYLVLTGNIHVLGKLYTRVLIPLAVLVEMRRSRAPDDVREWASSLPDWCIFASRNTTPDRTLFHLDPGERDAIQLALETGTGTLLMDEAAGRRRRRQPSHRVRGFGTTG